MDFTKVSHLMSLNEKSVLYRGLYIAAQSYLTEVWALDSVLRSVGSFEGYAEPESSCVVESVAVKTLSC